MVIISKMTMKDVMMETKLLEMAVVQVALLKQATFALEATISPLHHSKPMPVIPFAAMA